MQQALPNSLLEASHELAVQIGVSQAVFDILHSWAAVRIVHHNVKHLLDTQLTHCLVHIIVQPALPLLQAGVTVALYAASQAEC